MAFFRKSYRGRRFIKRRRVFSRYTKKNRLLSTIKKVVRKIAPKELKYKDTEETLFTGATTNSVYSLAPLAQGDTVGTRDGNKVYLRSVQGLMELNFDDTVIDSSPLYVPGFIPRIGVWIFQAKDISGATPALSNLLEDTTDWMTSWRNLALSTKFKVLKRFFISYDPEVSKTQQVRKFYLSWKKPLEIKYNSTGAGLADLQNNGIYIMFELQHRADAILQGWVTAKLKYRTKFYD